MRNSLLPVVTVIGLSLGALIGGAVLTETIFNLTGVGKTVFDAISARDYAVVQGFTLVIAVAFVIVNLVTDVLYTFLDPRVRVQLSDQVDQPSFAPLATGRRCRRHAVPRAVATTPARDVAQAVGHDRPRRPRLLPC